MFCQVHHGLTGGIAAADHIDVLAVAKRRLASARAIVEPAPNELILAGQVETTPLDARGADIGAGRHRSAVGEIGPDAIVAERGFYALPHHQDFDPELHRLLPSAFRKVGAVDALREAHVVLDH